MIPKKNHWLLLELARAPAHYSENCGIKEKEQDYPIQILKLNFRIIK